MKWAYNNNGKLCDVVMTHPSILFPQSYAEEFIEVPDEAQNGWNWDGIIVTAPPEFKPSTEQQWETIRDIRNLKLTETDYVVTRAVERNESVSDEWSVYREALRDITKQEDPFDITWPVPPT